MAFFKSVLGKLKEGLSKTREVFAGGIRTMLSGRRLDEQLILELEMQLLAADVGVAATEKLVAGVRADWVAGKMSRGEDVLEYLKREIKAMWPDADRRLREAPAGRRPIEPDEIGAADWVTESGDMRTLPCHLPEYDGIDGFYAARLVKLEG